MTFAINSERGRRLAERCIKGATLRALTHNHPHTDGETVLNSWSLYAPKELSDFAWEHRDTLAPRVEASLKASLEATTMTTPKAAPDRTLMVQALSVRLDSCVSVLSHYAREGVETWQDEEDKESAYTSAVNALDDIRAEIEALNNQ